MLKTTERILRHLGERGILLEQDKVLPNVVCLITGETLKGSWWSHPRSHEIFACLTDLADHPDVLFTKLVAGKVTLVHRRLWPALLAVGTSREPWQLRKISSEAANLLRRVEKKGFVLASGPQVKELERRLLTVARQEHTDSGEHKMVVESWSRWAKEGRCQLNLVPSEGRRQLEQAVLALGATTRKLPWQVSVKTF